MRGIDLLTYEDILANRRVWHLGGPDPKVVCQSESLVLVSGFWSSSYCSKHFGKSCSGTVFWACDPFHFPGVTHYLKAVLILRNIQRSFGVNVD